ncbi:MAG: Hsp20/alpha crystallin family protein, partial [Burkholderiales bacterium]
MANIVRRREQNELIPGRFDPAQLVRNLLGLDPFQAMAQVAPQLGQQLARFIPDFEVRETPEAYVFKADLPGVNLDDLEITVTGNRLLVSGQREAEAREEKDTYYAYERAYGSFSRAFTLPDDADTDHVRAEMTNGVLTLTIPKRPERQPKKVEVKGGEQQAGQQSQQQ